MSISFWLFVLVIHISQTSVNVLAKVEVIVENNDMENVLSSMLTQIKIESDYETLLIENCGKNSDIIDSDMLKRLKVPILLTQTEQELLIQTNYSKNLLTLLCLEANVTARQTIDGLAGKVNQMRHIRLVLYLNIKETHKNAAHLISRYFKYCESLHKQLNVLIIFKDFAKTKLIYAFEKYPEFRVYTFAYNNQGDGYVYFPNKVQNLHGHALFTMPDQNEPRSFMFRDKHGQAQLSGYVAKLVQAYAKYINATLSFPFPLEIGKKLLVATVLNYTRFGFIDIVAGYSSPKMNRNIHEFPDIVELAKWMPMLPVENYLEIHEMFLLILRSKLFGVLIAVSIVLCQLFNWFMHHRNAGSREIIWQNIFINDKALRGVLAQSFPMTIKWNFRLSCIFWLIFIVGFVTNTISGAFLNAFLTEPLRQPRINTFDDLQASNVKILLASNEIKALQVSFTMSAWLRYRNCFEIINSWPEFLERRMSLNTSNAYIITGTLWPFIEHQQSIFQHKLFRVSAQMFFEDNIYFSLPMQNNSIFRPSLDKFIHAVHDSGLMDYWRTVSFLDMVACGKMSFKDLSSTRRYNGMIMQDFYWLWLIYAISLGISILSFCIELLINSLRKS